MPREFSLDELSFIRKHWQIDMSALQLARYFGCEEADIDRARKSMKLKLSKHNLRMTAFYTPYPFQVAKTVRKFNWTRYLRTHPNGQEEIHSADSK